MSLVFLQIRQVKNSENVLQFFRKTAINSLISGHKNHKSLVHADILLRYHTDVLILAANCQISDVSQRE